TSDQQWELIPAGQTGLSQFYNQERDKQNRCVRHPHSSVPQTFLSIHKEVITGDIMIGISPAKQSMILVGMPVNKAAADAACKERSAAGGSRAKREGREYCAGAGHHRW
ncbi:hypothetical protein HispidOSU_018097, partial [Sigmodon hispidus]